MLTPAQFKHVKSLCEELVDATSESRKLRLDQIRASEPEVCTEVERLLDTETHRGGGGPVAGGGNCDSTVSLVGTPSDVPPGERIGPYRLLRKIGEGGMGEVFEAEQRTPVRRRVALKIIKRGMDSQQVLARFEAERQALAMMDHPTVAKVFDAGVTPGGRPYFVMEFVPGVPITEHCDRNRLQTRERLELILQVCEGMQHAHQKTIIHRDLKPSNVLVSVNESRPRVKIIDFGVAKATSQRLTEQTLFTELGVLIGTPEYMSPEQAEMTQQDIDTRTDVYSLGVVLYELLVGALPFESKELRRAGFDGIRTKIREEDPPKPSMRLSSLGRRSSESAARRGVDLRTLQRLLEGDLDWITMKSLEKDRARRYSSMQEMAADIQRFLSNESVLARPPSVRYKVGKFVRRNRMLVVAASVVVLALIVGATAASFGFVRASRERDRALAAEAVARNESENRQAAVDFLTRVLSWADPAMQQGRAMTLTEAVEKTQAEVSDARDLPPLVEASIRRILGALQADRGDLAAAEKNLLRALEIADNELDVTDPLSLKLLNSLGHAMLLSKRTELAMEIWERELSVRRQISGEDDPDLLTNMQNKAAALLGLERYEEAEPLLLWTLEGRTRVLGPDHPQTLATSANLAYLYDRTGRDEEAERLMLDTLARRKELQGPEHPRTLMTTTNLADYYARRGRYQDADELSRLAYEGFSRIYKDEDHPYLLESMRVRVEVLRGLGRLDRAERLAQECYRRTAAKYTAMGEETRKVAQLLAELLDSKGRTEEATRWRQRATAQ